MSVEGSERFSSAQVPGSSHGKRPNASVFAGVLLVETDRGLAAIATEVGYEFEFAFAKAWKRLVGVAPGRFRRRHSAPRPDSTTIPDGLRPTGPGAGHPVFWPGQRAPFASPRKELILVAACNLRKEQVMDEWTPNRACRAEAAAFLESLGIAFPSPELVKTLCEARMILRVALPEAGFADVMKLAFVDVGRLFPSELN